jgi:large subunit ribosomal protein L2
VRKTLTKSRGTSVSKYSIPPELSAKVESIEYAPRRTANLALLSYKDGRREYMLAPRTLKIGSSVYVGPGTTRDIGTTRPLGLLPSGCISYNVELKPGAGGKIARSAGTFTQLLAKTFRFVTLKLPSKEVRLVFKSCNATIGQVSNLAVQNLILGKAGRKRWLGRRPKVRGVAMNPNDHPHGGGEGRSPIGRKSPVTPCGKIALGPKTRDTRKKSNAYILRFRHVKTQ